MNRPAQTLLRKPDEAHDVIYGDSDNPQTVTGQVIDLDDDGYVVVDDSEGRRHYIPKGKVQEIKETATRARDW
jgi:biotin-(acetyl-CoA carboxylase) ligase